MTYPVRELAPTTVATIADGGANEITILILGNVDTAGPGARVVLHGIASVTAGTAATAVTIRVRELATIANSVVGTSVVDTVVAGSSYTLPIDVVLNDVDLAGYSFAMTVQETAATASGTVNYAFLGGYTA